MRLWEKGEALNTMIHRFTVSDDPTIDLTLARWDALGSAAHARVLEKSGFITAEERVQIIASLREIIELCAREAFTISIDEEDCHTAIENYLTKKLGESGKKIHTGRSRNDQVMTAMRLYLREQLLVLWEQSILTAESISARYTDLRDLSMPGYTHFQRAMPSSVGMWLHSFFESFLELGRRSESLFALLNSNPSEVGSGFGIPLPIDRQFSSSLMGFDRTQRSPIHVISSRGYHELQLIRWCIDCASVIEKFACDLMLYTAPEFGFFSIPNAFTTGSSIMPQKRNPDVIELLRATTGRVRGAECELSSITAKLPSNYHRDFQFTKRPVITAADDTLCSLNVVREVIREFSPHQERLAQAMSDDLYVTYDAFRLVREGLPFREAYQRSAERHKQNEIDYQSLRQDFSIVAAKDHAEMQEGLGELEVLRSHFKQIRESISSKERALLI